MKIKILICREILPEAQNRYECTNLVDLYKYAVWYKANPKDLMYVLKSVKNYFNIPDDFLSGVKNMRSGEHEVSRRGAIVLIYQDSIGLGYFFTEIRYIHKIIFSSEVYAVNGRGRLLPLNFFTYPGILIRRFIERTMFAELLFLVFFMLVSPIYVLVDLCRGRR